MTPYASGKDWTLYHGDCLEVLPTLSGIDAVVTDPPYGIKLDCENEASGGVGRQNFRAIHGDDRPFDPAPLMNFKDALIWGCNHFCDKIPPHAGQWYFWDKVTKNALKVRIAEGEFAWHKNGTKPRAFRHLWSGAYRASESGIRSEHPSQKPVELLKWCVSFMPEGCTILDPFTGSGSTGVACIRTGRKFIGIELEEGYCEIAAKRMREAESHLFADMPKEAIT